MNVLLTRAEAAACVLTTLREMAGLTQAQVAHRMRVTVRRIHQIETAHHAPDYITVAHFAGAVGITTRTVEAKIHDLMTARIERRPRGLTATIRERIKAEES